MCQTRRVNPKRFPFWFWAYFRLAFQFLQRKTSVFQFVVCRRLQLSLFWHLVFGFQQQHKRFFGFGVRCGFQFSYSCYSVSGFFVFHLHAMTLLRGMRDKPDWPYRVVALLKSNYAWDHGLTKNHRGYRGKKWQRKLRMKVKRQLWTVSLSYEEGKGGENFGTMNKFRCKFNMEERSLQKLKNSIWLVSRTNIIICITIKLRRLWKILSDWPYLVYLAFKCFRV